MWIFLWFIVAVIIIGATMWSTMILVQQKKAWAAFAKKHKFKFKRNKFFSSAEMHGVIKGYNISFFSAEQRADDDRKSRLLTVVQIDVNKPFVDSFAAVSPEMEPFLISLDAITMHEVKVKGWDKKNFISSRNKDAVDAYLTEERVKVITSLLNMKNANVLVLSDDNAAVIRIETSNPLHVAAQIEKFISKVLARVEKLKVQEDERGQLNAMPKDKAVELQPPVEEIKSAVEEVKPISEPVSASKVDEEFDAPLNPTKEELEAQAAEKVRKKAEKKTAKKKPKKPALEPMAEQRKPEPKVGPSED